LVKPLVREIEDEDSGELDHRRHTVEEKPYTDWRASSSAGTTTHSKGRNVKGMNLLRSTLYEVGGLCVPVAFELVKKTEWVFDEKKYRWHRKSPRTKNGLYRQMLKACTKNRIGFRYVLNDVWYASSENMRHVKEDLKKEFIMPIKDQPQGGPFLGAQKAGGVRASRVCRARTGHGTGSLYVEQVE
jgi:hypothetical protein